MVTITRDECDEEGYCKTTEVARHLPVRLAVDSAKRLIQLAPSGPGSPSYTVTFDHLGYRVHITYCLCEWTKTKYYVCVTRTPLELCHDYRPANWAD